MERDREAVRFVANPLDQQQRRIVGGERDRILAVARVEQLSFFAMPTATRFARPQLLRAAACTRR